MRAVSSRDSESILVLACAVSLVGLGFVLPFGETVQPAILNSSVLVEVLAGAAFTVAVMLLVGESPPQSIASSLSKSRIYVLIYVGVVLVATVTRQLPQTRYQLFALFVLATFCFYVIEQHSAGRWLRIVYIISLLHLLWAVAVNHRTAIAAGIERLDGNTHPVMLGFEAGAVLLISALRATSATGRERMQYVLVTGLALYVLYEAFSRTILISLTVALVLNLFWRYRKVWPPIFFFLVLLCASIYIFGMQDVIYVLGGEDPRSVTTASGRYDIWWRIISYMDEPLRGYGFAALYDAVGPDAPIYVRNGGLPAESSPIQAYLVAGVAGLAAWALVVFKSVSHAVRAARDTYGLSASLAVIVVVDAFFGIGMSGESFSWWWLLALWSFARSEKGLAGEKRGVMAASTSPRALLAVRDDLIPRRDAAAATLLNGEPIRWKH